MDVRNKDKKYGEMNESSHDQQHQKRYKKPCKMCLREGVSERESYFYLVNKVFVILFSNHSYFISVFPSIPTAVFERIKSFMPSLYKMLL